ncbi:hypothetical protein Bca4012_069376 [Brassica carinata]
MDLRRRQRSLSEIFLSAKGILELSKLTTLIATQESSPPPLISLSAAIAGLLDVDSFLYYAKIGLGTPSRDVYVQVDTGSDLLWVNCAGCIRCPSKSDLMLPPLHSLFLVTTAFALLTLAKHQSVITQEILLANYLVRDVMRLDLVTGNRQTGSTNGTIIFGCGSKQSGLLEESDYNKVDGIIGFGKSNSSMDGGGGIFAIGEVVSPKVKKTTPMLPKSGHYSVNLTSVEVGDSVLQLSPAAFDSRGVIVDSGTALVYLPDSVYMSLMNKILATHPELFYRVEDSFTCFHYTDKIHRLDRFPPVTFQFDKSASLTVYPRDYLLQFERDTWCFGWQSSGPIYGGILWLLGEMALSNKLVVYDIENQVIGWTNYNCSEGIQVKDEQSGSIYTVGAHNLSWSSSLAITKLVTIVSLLVHSLFYPLI